MAVNKSYNDDESVRETENGVGVWTTNCQTPEDKVYAFDEALDITGTGFYNISLLAILSLATLGMGVDIFGFSVVITGATCDFQLTLQQTSILFSVAFIGPITMSYPWGYISDTQGRKKSLLISMWGSFIVSTISAFSPNWIVLAVLKFISTSFSSCAQSTTYALLGESCPRRIRDGYMLVMTSVLDFCLAVYIGIAYGILNLDFSFDLNFITFTPWRLLALLLSLILGVSACCIHFLYESPKFLLNAGHKQQALDVLKGIYKWNGGKMKYYSIKNVYINEEGNSDIKNLPLLKSLWTQVAPILKPPLLWRSLQLYFLTVMVYGISNSYFMWFPILAEKFMDGISTADKNQQSGLCNMIVSTNNINNRTNTGICETSMEGSVFYSSLAQGTVFVIILLCLAKVAHLKRTLMIIILIFSSICGILAVVINDNTTSFIMFFGQLTNELVIGMIYSYFVDLYPTSYRGMAACLATMIARVGSISGVSLLGAYLMTDCSSTFYISSALMIFGVGVALMLPKDVKRN